MTSGIKELNPDQVYLSEAPTISETIKHTAELCVEVALIPFNNGFKNVFYIFHLDITRLRTKHADFTDNAFVNNFTI
jgi:hypothetical protein